MLPHRGPNSFHVVSVNLQYRVFILLLILLCTFRLNELFDVEVNQHHICNIRLKHRSVLCRGEADFRCDDRRFISELILKMSSFIASDRNIKREITTILFLAKISQQTSFLVNFSALIYLFGTFFFAQVFHVECTVLDSSPFVANIHVLRMEIPRK